MSNQAICGDSTPDPWMIAANGVFYLTFTQGNKISIWESPIMEDFHNARKSEIWKPPGNSPWSAHVWAPELHSLNGLWYIYASSTHPGTGNKGHRTIVLRSSHSDPMETSAWEFLGPLKGMPEQFSIDATVLSPNGRDLYLCWSGWPPGDDSDTQQELYLAQMVSPEEVVDHKVLPPVCICKPDQPWERFENNRRGICEGPSWLNLPNGAFTGIVYSGHASFTSDYKLGLLRLISPDADPLNPRSWVKRPLPLLINDRSQPGPFAPGHASFLLSPQPGDERIFCIYHATANWGEGFKNRKGRVLVFDPSSFGPHAQPICCSSGRPYLPHWLEGQARQQQHGGSGTLQEVQAGIGKTIDQYRGKAPASAQKYIDRFRKYL